MVIAFGCTLSYFVNGLSNSFRLEYIYPTVNETRKYIDYNGKEEEADCVNWYGCWRGYCWTGCCWHDCLDYNNDKVQHGEWCWSAPPGSKPNEYQKCKTDSDCSNCWICTGSCDDYLL